MKCNLFPSLQNIITIFLLLVTSQAISQQTTNTQYSAYGIGSTENVESGIFGGLGSSNISYFDSTVLNYFNPASYSSISKGQPLLSTGTSSRISTFSENGINSNSSNTTLSHFALGFSFANRFGLAFGFKPYSRRGYEFSSNEVIGSDTIKNTYSGSGSTNEAFLGLSSKLVTFNRTDVSFGVNLGYVFGSLRNRRTSQLNDLIAGGIDHKNIDIRGFNTEIALSINHQINEKHSFTLSSVYSPSLKYNAERSTNLFYAADVLDESTYFRLDSTGNIEGNINSTSEINGGINYRFNFKDVAKKSKVRNSELSFHLNYSFTNWKDYKETYNGIDNSNNFYNTSKISFGMQYTPESSFLSSASSSKIFEKIRYRAGFYNYTLPIQQSLNTINDYGVTLGFGIPIQVQKSMSSVNISVGYGQRNNGVSTDFRESYTSINFSLIMAPGNFEKWFVKRKYN